MAASDNGWELNPALMLSNQCNKSCEPCLRGEDSADFSLTRGQVERYFSDLGQLCEKHHTLRISFFTGGEPTIRRSGEWDIADLLISASDMPYMGMMSLPTNGLVFKIILCSVK